MAMISVGTSRKVGVVLPLARAGALKNIATHKLSSRIKRGGRDDVGLLCIKKRTMVSLLVFIMEISMTYTCEESPLPNISLQFFGKVFLACFMAFVTLETGGFAA